MDARSGGCSDGDSLTRDQTLLLRQKYISGTCQLHFGRSPLKVVRSSGPYLYDDDGFRYIDCSSRVNNVGHCHPATVAAAASQMATLTSPLAETGVMPAEGIEERYCQRLLETLPPNFQTCLFTSSGAEANDLALQLAKIYTKRRDVVVIDGSFHGAVNSLLEISPKAFKNLHTEKKPWVHVIPCPDRYRGSYNDASTAAEKYFIDAKNVIDKAVQNSGPIACFISEPVFVVYGVVVPPTGWLAKIYSYIHENGGLIIADEIQTGMGRSGSHYWAFQALGVVPDIITIGKPIGNGHPFAAVITSHKIASCLKANYRCGPVAATIGLSVLCVIEEEHLLHNATMTGKLLKEELLTLKKKHKHIGDVRGIGLMIGVDIVWCQTTKKPAPEIAEKISYRLKDEFVIIANEGEHGNILVLMPPLCLSVDDVSYIVSKLDKILTEVEVVDSHAIYSILSNSLPDSTQAEYGMRWPEDQLESDNEDSSGSSISNHYDSMD
ncbi:5-phosphohydroxy-L-lysine phospho-lyase-like isoform X1 [Schistocerca piceifrons]|uniref:5-phosphohydroxy-L-lysine phospho-lyase-like isoform X1 n=2 Tax=Schistocerca piceifrons TaxID=274613 RepID=UPI001F5FDDF4|nr:5-phosphohydroxy-L-lysine phospho-lyase-like isoform X1 [Schistocerca piceifrons]